MSESEVEQEFTPDGVYQPFVEEIIHQASIEVKTLPIPGSEKTLTLLRFHTPAKVYTVKLDDGGLNVLVNHLRGDSAVPRIELAVPGDIRNLRTPGV